VEDLAARAGLALANTSRHLQLLRRGGWCREGATASACTIGWQGRTLWLTS
jgi:DNA-binding IclR family transcriptional regulator